MGFTLSGLTEPTFNPLDIFGFEPGSDKKLPELTQVQKDFEIASGKKPFSEPWRYQPIFTTYGIINGKEISDLNKQWSDFKKAADTLAASRELYNDQNKGNGSLDLTASDGTVYTEAEVLAAFGDETKQLIYGDKGELVDIVDITPAAGTGTIGELTNNEDTTVAGTGTIDESLSGNTLINGIFYNDAGAVTGFETEADRANYNELVNFPVSIDTTGDGTLGQVTGTSAAGSTQGYNVFKEFVKDEVNLGYDESLSDEDVQDMQNGGVGPSGNTPIDGVFYNDAGGVIGFLTEADRARYNASQNPTINVAGSLYDYDGNYVGADPDTINVGGSLYDRQGNYLGQAQTGATGATIGGASSDNVMFDAYTAEQEAASARAAEAVELMDAGYGRYNAAVRKLGIVGRQGEEYTPLILDQLRMAEQEAAQPQFAAFGFGLNPQLGGMPQIGVQGVQGNTGGQSALTALSNAGLNQLQVAQQPYNRIALPAIDSTTGQPDFSQVNNPTIFKASTDV